MSDAIHHGAAAEATGPDALDRARQAKNLSIFGLGVSSLVFALLLEVHLDASFDVAIPAMIAGAIAAAAAIALIASHLWLARAKKR